MLLRVNNPRSVACLLSAALLFPLMVTNASADEPLQSLRAPFVCDSVWSGTTRSGHGLNDWNLDINRTSRTFSDPNHDLDQPILAQADGTVVYFAQSGYNGGAGAYLEVDYGDITVRYIHLVDGSIPDHLDEIGARTMEGELIGLLGATGNASHAHLHLEYFDSRAFHDTPWWQLPKANQIQIAMDGVPIDPGNAFASTNCISPSPSSPTTTLAPPHPFIDVNVGSYASDAITLLFQREITTGTTDTRYSPDNLVTREQMAAFLGRVWRLFDPQAVANSTQLPFDDVDPDSFAQADLHLLVDLGITEGTGPASYSPDEPVTREQMAAFLGRVWRAMYPEWPDSGTSMPFSDISPTSFAAADIVLIFSLEITTGTSDTTYAPDELVTREQMAAFLARLVRAAEI